MLLKPTGAVPHVGGALMQPGEPYYEILRSWIADGAKLDLTTPAGDQDRGLPGQSRSSSGSARKQQLRVLATYASGEVRDVTREAFLESGNTEVAAAGKSGLITAVRRGEAPDPGPVRRELCLHDADRDGRPHRLRLGRARRPTARSTSWSPQVEADEDPAVGPLHRRRVHPPGLRST